MLYILPLCPEMYRLYTTKLYGPVMIELYKKNDVSI